MEQRYKVALEIILGLCNKSDYISAETIEKICAIALGVEEGDEDVCA